MVSTIISRRKKDGTSGGDLKDSAIEIDMPGEKSSNPGLEMACEDLLKAIDSKSVKDLAKAMSHICELVSDKDMEEIEPEEEAE